MNKFGLQEDLHIDKYKTPVNELKEDQNKYK